MFPQLKKIDNESGIVLFIVLMTAIIMMIYSLGILTQSLNEINYAQQQIDQITTEQWAKGEFWQAETSNFNGPNVGISTVVDGRTYGMTINYSTVTNIATVTSNYDTFQ